MKLESERASEYVVTYQGGMTVIYCMAMEFVICIRVARTVQRVQYSDNIITVKFFSLCDIVKYVFRGEYVFVRRRKKKNKFVGCWITMYKMEQQAKPNALAESVTEGIEARKSSRIRRGNEVLHRHRKLKRFAFISVYYRRNRFMAVEIYHCNIPFAFVTHETCFTS